MNTTMKKLAIAGSLALAMGAAAAPAFGQTVPGGGRPGTDPTGPMTPGCSGGTCPTNPGGGTNVFNPNVTNTNTFNPNVTNTNTFNPNVTNTNTFNPNVTNTNTTTSNSTSTSNATATGGNATATGGNANATGGTGGNANNSIRFSSIGLGANGGARCADGWQLAVGVAGVSVGGGNYKPTEWCIFHETNGQLAIYSPDATVRAGAVLGLGGRDAFLDVGVRAAAVTGCNDVNSILRRHYTGAACTPEPQPRVVTTRYSVRVVPGCVTKERGVVECPVAPTPGGRQTLNARPRP